MSKTNLWQPPVNAAVLKVQGLILKRWNEIDPPTKNASRAVQVYLWDAKFCQEYNLGPRVAEVSLTTASKKSLGGCSFMQGDLGGGQVCFFAERLIIDLAEKEHAEDIKESEWLLLNSIWPTENHKPKKGTS